MQLINTHKLFLNSFNMKTLSVILIFFICLTTRAQELKYSQINTKEGAKQFSQGEVFQSYQTKENYIVKTGDTLTIGEPSTNTVASMGYGTTARIFQNVMMGKFRSMSGAQFLPETGRGSKIVIEEIQFRYASFGQNYNIMPMAICKGLNGEGYITIMSIDRATESGEIINPHRPMSKAEALAKLEEAKEMLDLQLITPEKFDQLKKELAPIITAN